MDGILIALIQTSQVNIHPHSFRDRGCHTPDYTKTLTHPHTHTVGLGLRYVTQGHFDM